MLDESFEDPTADSLAWMLPCHKHNYLAVVGFALFGESHAFQIEVHNGGADYLSPAHLDFDWIAGYSQNHLIEPRVRIWIAVREIDPVLGLEVVGEAQGVVVLL